MFLQPSNSESAENTFIDAAELLSTSMDNINIKYISPAPLMLTQSEIRDKKNRVTRRSRVDGIVNHLPGAIVEYPASGTSQDMAIAHVFPINPECFVHPKDNIQFSLGGQHSGQSNVICFLLHDKDTGEPVHCKQTRYSCCSVKKCSFNGTTSEVPYTAPVCNAWTEVFMKTLGFFCALKENGCSFLSTTSGSFKEDADSDDEPGEPPNSRSQDLVSVLKDSRSPRKPKGVCKGNLLIQQDKYGHYFISCEYFSKGRRNHLRLRNLNEYNIEYLVALFDANYTRIFEYELRAAQEGYGPLVPCSYTTVARAQKRLCPNWHRNSKKILQRGVLSMAQDCPCCFDIYQPLDLSQCPFILIVSKNPHSHFQPPRAKTPASVREILRLRSLLLLLGYRLADATPHCILLDHSLMHSLRTILNWTDMRDPGLGDLHPSLANSDHAARLINELRYEEYPEGTGLRGAEYLLKQHTQLPANEQYLRHVETFHDPKEGSFTIIICMFQEMSQLLLDVKRPTIDTSFKRLKGWQEFELEAWFPQYGRSIVLTRAFTSSESAVSHYMLFKLIFSIVERDTGQTIQFRHIHGDGIDTITADGHRGQALGLGLYCQEISKKMHGYCAIDWTQPLHALSPREHLIRCYQYCLAHYSRNVSKLRGQLDESILSAMMSLASAEPLPNFEETLAFIRSGGKKATDWLKDKQSYDGFYALAAIYWPESKIPLESWRAAPSTSNGNEQAHRNINRDGTGLTLLAGIMRGLHYDSRTMANIRLYTQEFIQPRDRSSSHFQRLLRGIKNKSNLQQKNVWAKDNEIKKLVEKATRLQSSVAVIKQSNEHLSSERERKRLKKYTDELEDANVRLKQLVPQGSGSVSTVGLQDTSTILGSQISREPGPSTQSDTTTVFPSLSQDSFFVKTPSYTYNPQITSQVTATPFYPNNFLYDSNPYYNYPEFSSQPFFFH